MLGTIIFQLYRLVMNIKRISNLNKHKAMKNSQASFKLQNYLTLLYNWETSLNPVEQNQILKKSVCGGGGGTQTQFSWVSLMNINY